MFWSKEGVLTKNMNFTVFIPKLRPLGLRIMKFSNFCPLSLQMQYIKGEDDIGTVAFEMRLIMNDERQKIDNDGCRLVAICHLGDSGDL